jgi:heat shock protein HslJ
MNNPNQTGINLTTKTDQHSISPGEKLEVLLDLANLGSTQDQLRINVEGIPLTWVYTEKQVVALQPGEHTQITLSIQPSASPNAHIGRYNLKISATSVIDATRTAQIHVNLTVAGYEEKGRLGVLLEGVQYSAIPGDQLNIPVVLINQGLSPDTFQLVVEGLPESWISVSSPTLRMEPGEVKETTLIVKPPRDPSAHASRHPFHIQVASQQAPNESVSIDCTLTIVAFTAFKSSLEAAQPEQNRPAQVVVQNLSNIPETFHVSWASPEDSLAFEPAEPQQLNVASGETGKQGYSVKVAQRPFFGGEKSYPYTVEVKASNQKAQTLESTLLGTGILPIWVLVAGISVLLVLCLVLAMLVIPGVIRTQTSTATAIITSTAAVPVSTATQSQVDQKPELVERNWYLVAYNDTYSSPGQQEAYILFNQNDTLIGYTGCKDLSGSYQTNYNQLSITNVNLGPGTCPDATLQQQEDATIAILRSTRSYYIANTAMQIAGDAGILNYSLTPTERPEEIQPPEAVIQVVNQAPVGQAIVFDGSPSTGQVPLVSWKWDFGDGTKASGEVVQHTYQKPGTYNAQLKVTDQRNKTGETTQQIHILALSTETPGPTEAPKPSETPQPTTPPDQPTPTLEPTVEQPTATPEAVPPQASIAGPKLGYIGEPVEFNASQSKAGSSPIVSYSWSFGNGANQPESPDPAVTYIYEKTGDYEVMVTVMDANGLSSTSTTSIPIEARLDTDVWTLATIKGDEELLPGTAITLQFLENELVGFAGCNEYRGEYVATDNGDGTYSVTIDKVTTSRRACPTEIMNQETAYLEALKQVTMATIEENMLTLAYPDGSLVFYLIPNE